MVMQIFFFFLFQAENHGHADLTMNLQYLNGKHYFQKKKR